MSAHTIVLANVWKWLSSMHDFYGMLIYSENIIVIPASLTLLKSIDLKQQNTTTKTVF